MISDLGSIQLGRLVRSDLHDVHEFASDPVVSRYQRWGLAWRPRVGRPTWAPFAFWRRPDFVGKATFAVPF